MQVNRVVLRAGSLALVAVIGLAGCSSIREALGIQKFSPDEFLVYTRKPLFMPSDLSLPPPQKGALPRNELPPASQAKLAVFPSIFDTATEVTSSAYSDTEIALLSQTRALNATSDIRQVVNAESILRGARGTPVAIAQARRPGPQEPVRVAAAEAELLPPRPAITPRTAPPAMPQIAMAEPPPATAPVTMPPAPMEKVEPESAPIEAMVESIPPLRPAQRQAPPRPRTAAAPTQTASLLTLRRTLDR